ncbi:MAG: hypothetical protein ACYCWW_14585 [Deltaproteobacteria bacterium]
MRFGDGRWKREGGATSFGRRAREAEAAATRFPRPREGSHVPQAKGEAIATPFAWARPKWTPGRLQARIPPHLFAEGLHMAKSGAHIWSSPNRFNLLLKEMANGIRLKLPAKGYLVLRNRKLSRKQLLQLLAQTSRRYDAVELAFVAYRRAMADRDKRHAEALELRHELAWALKAFYGRKSAQLVHFGVVPFHRRKLTEAENVQAQALGRETRKKRGTMGKRQKAKLKAGPVDVRVKEDGSIEVTPRAERKP